MSATPISGLVALGAAPATNDLLVVVDVSDTTQAATGSTKNMTVANLFTAPTITTSLTVTGTMTVSSTLNVVGNFSVATNKVTVAAATGNTVIAGTLNVTGGLATVISATARVNVDKTIVSAAVLAMYSVGRNGTPLYHLGSDGSDFGVILAADAATANLTWTDLGNFTFRGNIGAVGGVFSGAVTVGTTLGVTGNVAVATNKFNVTAASGNTAIAGTLGVTGNLSSLALTIIGTMATTNSSALNICISNGTAPTGTPLSGGFLWVESGALKYKGSGGTVTTLGNA